jgi:polyisoprenoid-binding protein YceI
MMLVKSVARRHGADGEEDIMKFAMGIVSGAAAALVAAPVSLALDSPDDAVFNTATVAIGCVALGLVAGLLWSALGRAGGGVVIYLGALAAGFVAVVVGALAGEQELERLASYVIPLAAIAFGIVAVLTPVLAGIELPALGALAGPLVAGGAAIALGLLLLLVGEEESGRLTLPEPTTSPAAAEAISADDVEGVAYVVVPDESQLTYTVREKSALLPTTNDAVGRTGALSGTVYLDGTPSEVTVDMSTLVSDQERRDGFVRENIFNTDPIVTFVVDDLGALPESYTPGTTITQALTGLATVRGVERALTFEVEARLDGETLNVVGRTDFTWADFQIDPPNTPVITVEDNVHIEVLIVARPQAEGT